MIYIPGTTQLFETKSGFAILGDLYVRVESADLNSSTFDFTVINGGWEGTYNVNSKILTVNLDNSQHLSTLHLFSKYSLGQSYNEVLDITDAWIASRISTETMIKKLTSLIHENTQTYEIINVDTVAF